MSDYDTDFAVWADEQARAIRDHLAGGNRAVDWEHVIEEIESLGASDRRELRSRLQTILIHLLKLQFGRDTSPRQGWSETVAEQRRRLGILLRENRSLRREVPGYVAEEIGAARKLATESLARFRDPGQVDPAADYTADQVLGDWWPGA